MKLRGLVLFDLKAMRKARGLTQMQAAEVLCTNQSTVSRWESEGRMPGVCRKAWNQHWELEELKNGKAKEESSNVECVDGYGDTNTGEDQTIAGHLRAKSKKQSVQQTGKSNKRVRRGSSHGFVEGRRRSGRNSDHRVRTEASADETEFASGLDAEE